jgi:hypothetical protein
MSFAGIFAGNGSAANNNNDFGVGLIEQLRQRSKTTVLGATRTAILSEHER